MYCLFLLFILWKLDESKKVWGGEIVQNFDYYTLVSTICNKCLEVSFNVCSNESWCVLSMWIPLTSIRMPTYQPIGPFFYYLGYQSETLLTPTSIACDHMDGGWTQSSKKCLTSKFTYIKMKSTKDLMSFQIHSMFGQKYGLSGFVHKIDKCIWSTYNRFDRNVLTQN
jgi:hypothetical protein